MSPGLEPGGRGRFGDSQALATGKKPSVAMVNILWIAQYYFFLNEHLLLGLVVYVT